MGKAQRISAHQLTVRTVFSVVGLSFLIALVQTLRGKATWRHFLFCGFTILIASPGVTVVHHRGETHRAFFFGPVVAFFLYVWGAINGQGPFSVWGWFHREHHKHTDKKGDPHSPFVRPDGRPFLEGAHTWWNKLVALWKGFWWAHIGWLLYPPFEAKPEENPKWKDPRVDKVVAFVDRVYPVWMTLGIIAAGFCGRFFGLSFWNGILWGGGVRLFYTYNVTWGVNSVCHLVGKQTFKTPTTGTSRNFWLWAFLAFGEGIHNWHHAFPAWAYYAVCHLPDLSGWIIRRLEGLGLVYDVVHPKPKKAEEMALRSASAQ